VNPEKTIILCPGCKRLIGYHERRCPHCGLRRPGSRLKRLVMGTGEESGRLWIKGIIYVNVAMFVVSLVAMAGGIRFSANPLYFLSPDSNSLLVLGATGSIPIYRYHRWWTLISASYLHGGILHIFFNMAAFWQLAPLAIREYGNWRMFTIYTLSGDLVQEIEHNGASYRGGDLDRLPAGNTVLAGGEHAWDLLTRYDEPVATGMYVFTVKDLDLEQVQVGKFLVIK